MNTLKVETIKRVNPNRIEYAYSIEGEWARYFELGDPMWVEYSEPVDQVPDSVAVLPLIGNVIVLASLMDADIYVDEIDQDFYQCVEEFIHGFESIMPEHVHFKRQGLIHANRLVHNPMEQNGEKGDLLYFSGGLDATSSMITHLEEKPSLVSVWGADIPWNQEDTWNRVLKMNQEVADRHGLELLTIRTNLRKSLCDDNINTYSYELVHEWWWPAFHHSVAMMCLSAPLACGRREKLYFGSAFSQKCKKEWGKYVLASDPAIDNHVRFCGCQVVNDGYEFTRVDKCKRIGEYYSQQVKKPFLRVCYLSNTGTNCGQCEKCIRTIMAIKVAGYDPCDYGFQYNEEELPRHFAAGMLKMAGTGKFPFLAAYKEIHTAYREWYTPEQVPAVLRVFYETEPEDLADFLCITHEDAVKKANTVTEEPTQSSQQPEVQETFICEEAVPSLQQEEQADSFSEELQRKNEALQEELAYAREAQRSLEERLMVLQNSRSWKITKPLRSIGQLGRKVRHPDAFIEKLKTFVYDKGRKLIDRNIPKDSWKYEYTKLRLWFVCSDHYETRMKPMFTKMLEEYSGKGCSKGWLTRFDYWLCWIFLGAEPEDYFDYEFFRKGWVWRNHHITHQRLNFIDPIFNKGENRQYIENKAKFYEKWSAYIKRKWCIPQEVSFEEFRALLGGFSRILVKPMSSFGGHGIYALDINSENLESVYEQLHTSEEKIVAEEYVYQKGFLHEISPSSLNPLRVTTVRVDNDVDVRYSFFTTSCHGNIIANDCSGGISFPVDTKTGKMGVGQGFSSNNHRTHPDTGMEVTGKYVPDWERIKEFAREAHRHAPEGLGLIGWDICWNDGEISLIEGNRTPAFPELPTRRENQWKAMQTYLDRMDQLKD